MLILNNKVENGAIRAWMESGAVKGIEGVDVDIMQNLREMVGVQEGGITGIASGGVIINTGGITIAAIAVVFGILLSFLACCVVKSRNRTKRTGENFIPLEKISIKLLC